MEAGTQTCTQLQDANQQIDEPDSRDAYTMTPAIQSDVDIKNACFPLLRKFGDEAASVASKTAQLS